MLSPKHLVGTLLEADDLLPSSDDSVGNATDVKNFVDRKVFIPFVGSAIHGYYRTLLSKVNDARRTKDIDGNGSRGIKVDNNTWLILHPNGHITVRFHWTDIITVEPDDTLTATASSFHTMTTLSRICEWLPGSWSIYQKDGGWYWHSPAVKVMSTGEKTFTIIQPFSNGDKIMDDGTLNPLESASYKLVRKRRALRPM